jgi:hypothetical protein
VTFRSQKIDDDVANKKQELDRELLSFIREELLASNNQEVQNLAKEIFDTEEGKQIMEEYLNRKTKQIKLI